MIDTKALYGAIVANGLTQKDVAHRMEMAPKTFYLKMKKGVFGSDEIEFLIKELNIKNPMEIFFADKVT